MKKQISNILKIIVIAIIIILFRQTQIQAVKWGGKEVNSDEDLQSLVISGQFFKGEPTDLIGKILPDLGSNTINKVGGKCIQNNHFAGNGFGGYKVSTIVDLNNFSKNMIVKPGTFVSYRSSTRIKTFTMAGLGSVNNEYHRYSYDYVNRVQTKNIPTSGHGISSLGYLMYAAREETSNQGTYKTPIELIYWLDQSTFEKDKIVNKEINTGSEIPYNSFETSAKEIREADNYANSSAKYSFNINKNNQNSNGTVRTATFTKPTTSSWTAYATYNETNGNTYVGPYSLNYNYSYNDNKLEVESATVTKSNFKIKGYTNTRDSADIKNFEELEKRETFYIVIKGKLTEDFNLQIKIKNPVIKARMIFLVGVKKTGTQNLLIFQGEEGYTYDALTIPVKVTPEEPEILSLKINKVDSETGKGLDGVEFTIVNEKGEYLDNNGKVSSTEYKHTTKNGGWIIVENVPEGTYIATETKTLPGYKLTDEKATIKVAADGSNSGTVVIKNTPDVPEVKYVDLEGTVFLDGRDGKQSLRNNIYDDGEGFNGVKVTLKRNGQVVANVASGYDSDGKNTGTAGHYKFLGDANHLKIEADHLAEYTIEFEYNGLKYESVAVQPEITAGASSKAKEKGQEREAFNTRYSTVTADTKISNGQSTNKSKGGDIIRYASEPYTSRVIYQTNAKDDKGNAYDNDGYADDQYHITSYTTEAGLDLSKPNKEGGYPYDPSKDVIVDLNFGIYEREHPDVAITTDLATAETSINGYTQIYPYQKRYDQIGSDSAFTVEVKSSDAYYPTYQRKLYKSDVQYTKETSDGSELAVYLTYKVAIRNQSSSINVTVNDIVDYFSKDVTGGIVAVGTDVNTLSEIPAKTNGNRYQITNTNGMQYSSMQEDSGYSKQYITLNKEIKTGEKYEFYVQYKMSIDAIRKTIEEDVKFNNVFELNTVSARANNGEIWTAVDMDSAVGNCVPSDRQTMEDDTDYAPGIDITTKSDDARLITGIVFEDQTSAETKAGQERNGNGQYEEGEVGVPNATVQLIDIDRGGQIAYSNTNGTDIKSGNDGNYTINGFIPGNYIIKYTYGNGTEKYTAQQYKSTIYVDQARANVNYANGYHNGVSTGNKYWYLDDIDARKSDAIDNYNGEIKTLYDMSQATVNMSRTEIEKIWNHDDGLQHILSGTNIDNTISIDAFTPHMAITVEKTGTQEGAYTISNVDFGIAERTRYRVQIDKVINRIKLVQADGSILRDFTGFDNKLPENTKAIRSQRGVSRGFVQFEVDSELLQTTTLLVEYGFKGTNISEVEYVDEAYYKYGIVPQDTENKVVKLSIANIIDYVDNELQYAENSQMITDGKAEITNKSNGWSTIELNKDENKKYVSADVLKALYNENGQCAYSTILISNGLDTGMLKIGESRTISLSLNKTLSPSQDKMRYENVTEVVEVKKTWGRELSMVETSRGAGDEQKLGNFDPTDPEDETKIIKVKDPDTNYSETIIINPPTGADRNSIILYITIGIVALAILAAGVIIIKKKILR